MMFFQFFFFNKARDTLETEGSQDNTKDSKKFERTSTARGSSKSFEGF